MYSIFQYMQYYRLQTRKLEMSEPCECPLCLEELETDDLSFYPCPCGYQVPQSSVTQNIILSEPDLSVLLEQDTDCG